MGETTSWLLWLVVACLPFPTFGVRAVPPKAVAKESPVAYLKDQQPPGEVFVQDALFNKGAYGLYVEQTFRSNNVTVPRLNMQQPFTYCDDGSYIFVTPRGEVVDEPLAVIYDASGSLVWTPSLDLGHFYNFQVQQYKGEYYLIFWAGDPQGGHGNGSFYMYDKHYNLVRSVTAGNGFGADLHSFTITSRNTAILTIYDKVKTDIAKTSGQSPVVDKWMMDCLFQELDLQTGEVLLEWRASEHFSLKESYAKQLPGSEEEPWDWFHINTVEKDSLGNYLISARHLRCVAYVSGKNGKLLWRLGGEFNDFADLSNGEATKFVGQHDVHWDGEGQYITMFDNRADWEFEAEHVSKGKRIEVDLNRMTAKIDMTFVHPENIFAFSQGSYQTQPNGNVVLGYGYTGAMTEFSPQGDVLCDMYIQPSSRFSSGDVQSYRNLKFHWTGIPLTPPDVLLEDNVLYVSWMGSTEVRKWTIEHSPVGTGTYERVTTFDKTGFETTFTIPVDQAVYQYLRILALDSENHVLHASEILDLGPTTNLYSGSTSAEEEEPSSIVVYERHRSIEAMKVQDEHIYDLGVMVGYACIGMLGTFLVFAFYARPRMLRRWMARYCDEHGEPATTSSEHLWQRLKALKHKRFGSVAYELLQDGEVEAGGRTPNDDHT
ncbi:Hypothetical predicted protein [Lecanosticta acicola]|uniref:ASST-domain-containing protein n=1 Tax=Lecanosticta acicola TaxID=111012 RepID=A0AAI8YVK4_9PEZI|nr:Hypothetical predicted protein [Lecanosticta acicola]